MAEPRISTTVATPLAHRKRKHAEIVDLTNDDEDEDTAPAPNATANNGTAAPDKPSQRNQIDDDEIGGDDASIFEDILDQVELDPYKPCELANTS